MLRFSSVLVIFVAVSSSVLAQNELPTVLDDRLKIELVAEHPDLVTPTGIDVDHLGRVFVIESNTHFPPEGYQGHPTDRLLVIENPSDPEKKKITVFADGLKHAMSVAVKPIWLEVRGNGGEGARGKDKKSDDNPSASHPRTPALPHPLTVFIATRNEILLLTDTDGDLKADERKRLVFLDTAGNYPHNALAGFAFDALGNMFFGLGENMANDYKLIGSDGTTLTGIEAGKLYRCKPDGSKLEQWATGFWNPHASCFDAFGRLFTVDNDPDSRPPCRLLHIIPGGDYGYRFRNGRKGTHPFTSWNGEIPGTLPMVAGTGEAPSGIVCYESDGFPEDYLGTLLVGSWGDHRIDQFVLEPKGASFTSKAKPIIKGGENFRPVGLAVAPDGSLYFSDWVLKDYKLHGKGRVWRVRAKENAHRQQIDLAKLEVKTTDELETILQSARLDVRRIAVTRYLHGDGDDGVSDNQIAVFDLARRANSERSGYELFVSYLKSLKDGDHFDSFNLKDDTSTPCEPALAEYLRHNLHPRRVFTGDYYTYSTDAEILRDKYWANKIDDPSCRYSAVRWGLWLMNPYFAAPFGDLGSKENKQQFSAFVEKCDPFTLDAVIRSLNERSDGLDDLLEFRYRCIPTTRARIVHLLARRRLTDQGRRMIKPMLNDSDVIIRRLAVQWIGEDALVGYRPDVEALLADPTTTPDLFLACLATLSLLDGQPASEFEKNPPTQYIAAMVKDANRPATLRATALRMLPASAPELDEPLLTELLSSNDATLRIEAVRTLANSPLPKARGMLMPIASKPQASIEIRAEAIAGLCNGPHDQPLPGEIEALLTQYARGDVDVNLGDASQKRSAVETLQLEALRSLRGRATDESKIRAAVQKAGELASDDAALKEAIEIVLTGKSTFDPQRVDNTDQLPDPIAGRRVFFHHNGPLCAKCHTVQGRGGQVGPDLTVIARTMDREKLLASILTPSKEISPQFTTWVIETASGKTHTGFILEDNRTGQIKLGTPTGEVIVLQENEIETREPSKVSVMPEKLHERMTSRELRDLLAFLETLK